MPGSYLPGIISDLPRNYLKLQICLKLFICRADSNIPKIAELPEMLSPDKIAGLYGNYLPATITELPQNC